MKQCKTQVEQVYKSKLSSNDWRDLGSMHQDLQLQELMWLDAIEDKQAGLAKMNFCVSMIPASISLKEAFFVYSPAYTLLFFMFLKVDILFITNIRQMPILDICFIFHL